MKLSRQVSRKALRYISEVAAVNVLGPIPRRDRRACGRLYASAAYRRMWSLDVQSYKGGRKVANAQLVEWIIKQFDELTEEKK